MPLSVSHQSTAPTASLLANLYVGDPARWHGDRDRGRTFSILPAYTTEGLLPCTGIREGFYNSDLFYEWIVNDLLPHCNPFPQSRSVLIMDNVSMHIGQRIKEAVETKGIILLFLPPYSPDYSPIELVFSLLKAWMKRHWQSLQPVFSGDFPAFINHAIEASECDRFAKEHFKHSGAGFMFQGDYEQFCRELEDNYR